MGKKRTRERPEGNGVRTLQLEQLIREEINLLLRNEVGDPRLAGMEITFVELTTDGSCARLWFTAEDDRDRSDACARVVGFLRVHLAENLGLKRTPDLRFK